MTSACPSAAELRRLLNGTLSGPEATRVEDHLEECLTCQGALGRLAADGQATPGARLPASIPWSGRRIEHASTIAAGFLDRLIRTVPHVTQRRPDAVVVQG